MSGPQSESLIVSSCGEHKDNFSRRKVLNHLEIIGVSSPRVPVLVPCGAEYNRVHKLGLSTLGDGPLLAYFKESFCERRFVVEIV